MEEYRKKVESLEAEKTRLQDLLNRSEKVYWKVACLFVVLLSIQFRMKMLDPALQSG